VARFATDLFRIKAQIVCKFYPPELIVEMSGVMNTPEGQNPQLLQAAVQMLSNSTIRDFHIQVEADTLAQIDEQADKQNATEAVKIIGSFLESSLPMVSQAPEMLPMMSEMLLFLVRRYRAGRGLETAIEQAMKALQAKAQQAQAQPQQNPEIMKLQAEQQAEQMRMQAQAQGDQMKLQAEAQLAQAKAQLEMQMQQAQTNADMQLEQMKEQFAQQIANNELQVKAREMQGREEYERWKAELDAATKVLVARIGANPGVDLPLMEAQQAASEKITQELGVGVQSAVMQMAQIADNMANLHGQTMQGIGEAVKKLGAPKKVVRGADGLVIGVETL
jgi:hypothetical protein